LIKVKKAKAKENLMFINVSWSLKPILLSSLILLSLIYGYHHFKQNTLHPQKKNFWAPILFLLGLTLVYALAISPIDHIGRHSLFFVHMLENMVFVYLIPCLLLNGLSKEHVTQFYQEHLYAQKILKLTSGIIPSAILFNLLFLCLHIPTILEITLHHPIISELTPILLLGFGFIMWGPILSPIKNLRLPFSEQMFYLITLILGQVPLFAVLTFSDQGLFPTYLEAERISILTAYTDQYWAGWLFKLSSLFIFSAAFVLIVLRWNSEQRSQDKDENTVVFENFGMIQRATRREG